MKINLLKPITAFLLLYFFVNASFAERHRPFKDNKSCQYITKGEAINRAKQRNDSKVVGVQLIKRGNASVYRVRLLVGKKRIKSITINACR